MVFPVYFNTDIYFLELVGLVSECRALTSAQENSRSWKSRMKTLDESWSQQRPTLMEDILECETPSGSHCETCDEAGPLIVWVIAESMAIAFVQAVMMIYIRSSPFTTGKVSLLAFCNQSHLRKLFLAVLRSLYLKVCTWILASTSLSSL